MIKLSMILIFFGLIIACNHHTEQYTKNRDYYSQNIDSIFSPSKTKYIVVYENGYTNTDAQTQLIINFIKKRIQGGGSFFVANGTNLNIDIKWINNNDLLLKYPENLEIIIQDTFEYFLGDFVKINYQPIRLDDSLKSEILKYELISIRNTSTSILRGQLIDYNTKKPFINQRITIESAQRMFIDTTDINGFYKFDMLPADKYRLLHRQKDYFDFILDTIYLETGVIKELCIGMINKN